MAGYSRLIAMIRVICTLYSSKRHRQGLNPLHRYATLYGDTFSQTWDKRTHPENQLTGHPPVGRCGARGTGAGTRAHCASPSRYI
eukprot:scaffold12183_cov68-Phaeocystis_antarctica.AAC.9